MMSSMIPSQTAPNILDRHVKTTIHLSGLVMHKVEGVMGPFYIRHPQERIPECKFCQALGIKRIESRAF